MKVTVLIGGREAVPVRALPFVTGWHLSPDSVAKDLAKHGHRASRSHGLRAFQFDPIEEHPPITPSEWERFVVGLDALEVRLRRDNGGESDITTYLRWRNESTSYLPKGCFVWRDEFESEYRAGHTSVSCDENDLLPNLNFSPLLADDHKTLVMEGFDAPNREKSSPPEKWPWGAHETKALRHLAAAAQKFWARYDPSDPTTAVKNEEVVAWLKKQGVTTNLASAMATILRADGIPTGPRK